MTARMDLKWIASLSASACHAADLARRGLAADCPLVEAVAQPAQRLVEEIRASGIDEPGFWTHLLPLSAQVENNRQLIEGVLRRASPIRQGNGGRTSRLAACIADIEAAVGRAQPGLVEELLARAERVRSEWDERGPGMLARIGELTSPGIVASSATVAPLWPAIGGYASAYVPMNLARIELDAADRGPICDVVRVVWLLAQMNLDLPMFSETIPADRLPRSAALAMLPAVLQVAEEARVSDEPPPSLDEAIESLRIEVRDRAWAADKLRAWWQSYLDVRPDWDVALVALDRMLGPLQC